MKLKLAPFCSSKNALSDGIRSLDFGRKPRWPRSNATKLDFSSCYNHARFHAILPNGNGLQNSLDYAPYAMHRKMKSPHLVVLSFEGTADTELQ